MKKLLLTLVAVAFTAFSFASDVPAKQEPQPTKAVKAVDAPVKKAAKPVKKTVKKAAPAKKAASATKSDKK